MSAHAWSNQDVRRAYGLASQFGPDRARPLLDRVEEMLPHLDGGRTAAIVERVHAFEARAWTLAELVCDDSTSSAAAKRRLAAEFPDLAPCASTAISQATWFVMR